MDMFRSIHIASILLAILLLVGCSGSKSFSKKGEKLDEAGLYAEAADMFLQAARRNAKNTDAKIGLKKTGQQVLNDELSTFFKNVAMGGSRAEAVASYQKAVDYQERVRAAGVMLEIPDHYKADFEKVKGEYLVDLYNEGQALFEKEEFAAAERVFAKIAALEPNYKDASSLQDVAYLEPLYRSGTVELTAGNFRKAYAQFKLVTDKNSGYKDASSLREECITKGQFVVAVLPFTATNKDNAIASKVQAHAMTALTSSKDPFLKVVDRENMEKIMEEQRLSLSGVVDEQTAVRVGNLIGAHAVLMGTVVDHREIAGSVRRSTKDGFEQYRVQQVNKETGEKYYVTRYKPVRYSEYFQENKVVLSFNYRLVSLETGEVLVSRMAEKEAKDHAYYATYSGNKDALLPMGKGSADLSASGRRELRSLLSASHEVKSVATLTNEVLRTASESMVQVIEADLKEKLP
ncbi:MAG: hypothetical protein KDC00_06465 [Flavobacteriales bacterium]|nr:hypothetical protein [Flavobacteriales bacterium]